MTLSVATRWLMSLAGASAVSIGVAQFALSQTANSPIQSDESSVLRPPGDAAATPELVPPPQEPTAAPAADQQQSEAQVLEEGPVHEAFATPIAASVTAGEIVSKEPPQPINETPPEYRPEGENVEWIPGYWMWLDDRSDFVWVSGVWRAIPPGRAWTPGHWAEAEGGYVWVSGFWSDVTADEVAYLPYPPESLEEGPSTAAPSDNHFWIPGCWTWQNQQYSWRAGYWYPGQQNWMWTPDHYVYTPRGAVLVNGYWDYPVQRRGLLYAPVYWNNGYRYGNNYAYTPHRVVNTALLLSSLFINDNRGYYYYGNGYRGRNNFHPWYAGGRSAYYSPFYGFYSWQYGRDSNQWRDRFDYDRRGRDFGDRQRGGGRYGLVGTVDDLQRSIRMDGRGDRDGRGDHWDDSFRRLTDNERREALERSQKMQQFRNARHEFEGRERNNYRAQLTDNNRGDRDGDRNRSREARANVPDNFRPSTFRLQTADGAEDLRRQSRERYQRYQQQVMRQDLDNRGENRGPRADQPNRSDQPGRPDQVNRGDRERGNQNPGDQIRNRSDIERSVERQRQSIENRQQQQQDRIRQLQQDQRNRTFGTPNPPRRGNENVDRGRPGNVERGDSGSRNRTPQPNFRSPNDSPRSGGSEARRGPSPNRGGGGEARGNSGFNRGGGGEARRGPSPSRSGGGDARGSGGNRGGGGEARGGGNRGGGDGNRGGGGGNRGGGNRGGGGGRGD